MAKENPSFLFVRTISFEHQDVIASDWFSSIKNPSLPRVIVGKKRLNGDVQPNSPFRQKVIIEGEVLPQPVTVEGEMKAVRHLYGFSGNEGRVTGFTMDIEHYEKSIVNVYENSVEQAECPQQKS